MALGVLLTYDIHEDHEAVKQSLIDLGWSDLITGKQEDGEELTSNLPNTTLWKADTTNKAGLAEFMSCTPKDNIVRADCFGFDSWWGIVGDKHSDDE